MAKMGSLVRIVSKLGEIHSKVVSTHLWNTPLNLYQPAIKGFLSYLARGIAWGVL